MQGQSSDGDLKAKPTESIDNSRT